MNVGNRCMKNYTDICKRTFHTHSYFFTSTRSMCCGSEPIFEAVPMLRTECRCVYGRPVEGCTLQVKPFRDHGRGISGVHEDTVFSKAELWSGLAPHASFNRSSGVDVRRGVKMWGPVYCPAA